MKSQSVSQCLGPTQPPLQGKALGFRGKAGAGMGSQGALGGSPDGAGRGSHCSQEVLSALALDESCSLQSGADCQLLGGSESLLAGNIQAVGVGNLQAVVGGHLHAVVDADDHHLVMVELAGEQLLYSLFASWPGSRSSSRQYRQGLREQGL